MRKVIGLLLVALAALTGFAFIDYGFRHKTLAVGSLVITGDTRGATTTPTITRYSATALEAPGLNLTGDLLTESGVGAKNGAAVTVVEAGDGAVHRTTFTLDDLSITMTDAGAAGSHGSHKLYDFPAGVVQRLGCSYNLTTLAGAGGLSDTAAIVGALGSAATGTGDATLTTTEADFVASTTGTLSSGAGSLKLHGAGNATGLDGHTTPIALRLNVAVADAGSTASDTLTVNGTVDCLWANAGDY